MTSESKILTVSYGTFSCTLEGFDDPFNTMKAIAEYFRDLAAEDRYFGAEPPQPDAAMLHRIAEREVSRLVDTRVREHGVHLRPKADPAASPQDDASPARPMSGTTHPLHDDATDLDDQQAVEPVEPSLQDVIPDGVAAKLARIRRSVTPPSLTTSLPEDLLDPIAAEAEANAPFTDANPEMHEDPAPAMGSDVLSRLGALVQSPDALDEMDEETAPETADLGVDPALADAEDFEADASGMTASAELAEDLAEPLAATDEALAENEFADSLPEDSLSAPDSLVEAMADDLPPEIMAEPEQPDATEVAEAMADGPTDAPPAKAGGRSRRVNSRIVRLHPDGAEDAESDPNSTRQLDDQGEEAEVARLLRQADDVMADSDNRRRIDALAQLKAAVVATEADRAVTGEPKASAAPSQDPYRDDLAQVVQPDDPPEVKPRRKTVSVRPTEPRPGTIRPGMITPPPLVLVSEQRIDRPTPTPAPTAPPTREGQPMVALRTGRLTGAIGMGAAAAPMQPQRKLVLEKTPHANMAEVEDDDDLDEDLSEVDEAGLASFAERVGVKSMADMLEAAAAYATCIEKRPQFTRPQLMRRLMASAGGRPVSREDGLRSFGTLLRTGRIEKISRGQYTLAESSPYLAEARRLS